MRLVLIDLIGVGLLWSSVCDDLLSTTLVGLCAVKGSGVLEFCRKSFSAVVKLVDALLKWKALDDGENALRSPMKRSGVVGGVLLSALRDLRFNVGPFQSLAAIFGLIHGCTAGGEIGKGNGSESGDGWLSKKDSSFRLDWQNDDGENTSSSAEPRRVEVSGDRSSDSGLGGGQKTIVQFVLLGG